MLLVTPALVLAAVLGATRPSGRFAPLPIEEQVSTHAPFEMGACGTCHDATDPTAPPGRLLKPANVLCFECHDDYQKRMKGHPAPEDPCTSCHSPHNARKKKLLLR